MWPPTVQVKKRSFASLISGRYVYDYRTRYSDDTRYALTDMDMDMDTELFRTMLSLTRHGHALTHG